jgi:hypothetical protein
MSTTTWAMIVYGFSAVLALLLLYAAGPRRWYLHVLSLAAALAVGLMPIPPKWNTPQMSIIIGFTFFFLFLWGIAAPLFLKRRRA